MPPKKANSPILWVVLIVVLLAAIAVAAYAYWNKNQNSNTSVNQNVNVALNSNKNGAGNQNVNTAVNQNTNLSTSDWQTYSNTESGFSIKLPKDWTTQDVVISKNPNLTGDAKFVRITNPQGDRTLELGVREVGDKYLLTSRTMFFIEQRTDETFEPGEPISIDGVSSPTTLLMNSQKTKQWFLGSKLVTQPVINGHEIYAEYKVVYPLSNNETYENNYLVTDITAELPIIRKIISSTQFLSR